MDKKLNIHQIIDEFHSILKNNVVPEETKWSGIDNLSASDRHFYRYRSNEGSYVCVYDPDFNRIKAETLTKVIDRIHNLNINIPKLIHIDKTKHTLIWEDIGDDSLLRKIVSQKWTFEKFRTFTEKEIIPILVKCWKFGPDADLPEFGFVKYMFEWDFHVISQLSKPINLFDKNPAFLELLLTEYASILQQLLETRSVLIHRDLQSTNMFFKNNQLYLLDFQDMRNGHPLYDLVSFIYDSYTPWNWSERYSLLMEIIDNLAHEIDSLRERTQLKKEAEFLIVQRKIHDAGAFVYNFKRTGRSDFLQFVLPTLEMARQACLQCDKQNLTSFITFLKENYEKMDILGYR
ncbi:MAG: hypothetical protein Kow00108_00890 [Calditrichia bacterium]